MDHVRMAFARLRGLDATTKFSTNNMDKGMVVTICLLVWYCCSLTLTTLNKTVLDTMKFPYVFSVTTTHFLVVGVMMYGMMAFRPQKLGKDNFDAWTLRHHYFPIALFSALEVSLTNLCYSRLSLALLTVIKSTLVVLTYLLSVALKMESFNVTLASILLFIVVTVGMSVPGLLAARPSHSGLMIAAAAIICAACRWTLVQRALETKRFTASGLITYTQPLAAVCLLPGILFYDIPVNAGSTFVGNPWMVVGLVLCCAVLVCIILVAEFQLVEVTSSVTLTVGGVGKECFTIILSMVVFKEHITIRSAICVVLSLVGIGLYGALRSGVYGDRVPEIGGHSGIDFVEAQTDSPIDVVVSIVSSSNEDEDEDINFSNSLFDDSLTLASGTGDVEMIVRGDGGQHVAMGVKGPLKSVSTVTTTASTTYRPTINDRSYPSLSNSNNHSNSMSLSNPSNSHSTLQDGSLYYSTKKDMGIVEIGDEIEWSSEGEVSD